MKKIISLVTGLFILIPISYIFFDKNISSKMSQVSGNTLEIFEIVTMFGSPLLIVACIGMLVRFFVQTKIRKKNLESQLMFLFLPITVISAWGISHLLKFIFGRIRPSLYQTSDLYGFTFFSSNYEMTSFPSGHTVLITAFLMSFLIFKPKLKWVFYFLIFIISVSRIVLNKHYLSDVIVGLIIGLIVVEISKKIFSKKGYFVVKK